MNKKLKYNSYVVSGEKTALIEGAGANISDDTIKTASYAVINHAFPALGIERILSLNPDIEIVGTIAAIKNLKEMTNRSFNEHVAKDGAELDLGGVTLKFLITPNLNWPDTMMTYDMTNKTLFSGLAFGSYGDLREFYDTELSRFKPFVLTAMERLCELEINTICPQIGQVLTDISVINDYANWSKPSENNVKSAVIFYASSTGNTALMSETIKNAMLDNGVDVKIFDVKTANKQEMLCALYGADMLAFGSPTIHRGAVKPIWDIIADIDLVNMKHMPCMVFGSYGWGGEGIHYLHNHLKLLRLKPFEQPFGCLFKPSEEDLAELKKYTNRFLESLNEI